MEIIRLKDVVEIIKGRSVFAKKDFVDNGSDLSLHYGVNYKIASVIDDNTTIIPFTNSFFRDDSHTIIGDSVMVTTSETKEDIPVISYINTTSKILVGGEQYILRPNISFLVPKYIYYWIKVNKKQLQQYITGMKVFRIHPKDFGKVIINLPTKEKQQEIIDIISHIEERFT